MSLFTPQARVAVFRGGQQVTSHRSMRSGAVALDVLESERGFSPVDVMVSSQGEWLVAGRAVNQSTFLQTVDSAFVAVLGQYGEDGQIARALQRNGVRYTGAAPYTALETWQKNLAAERLQRAGIATPRRVVAHAHSNADWHSLALNIQELFGPSYVVKPLSGTQHSDVHFVERSGDIPRAITAVLNTHPACVIEEQIAGQPLTVTSIPGLRNQTLYHSPALRYQHDISSTGQLAADSLVHDVQLGRPLRDAIKDTLEAVYTALELTSAVRSDLVVSPRGDIYVIEINTVFPMDAESATHHTLASVGVTPVEYILHQLRS